jgi:hypothetical protein
VRVLILLGLWAYYNSLILLRRFQFLGRLSLLKIEKYYLNFLLAMK